MNETAFHEVFCQFDALNVLFIYGVLFPFADDAPLHQGTWRQRVTGWTGYWPFHDCSGNHQTDRRKLA